MCGRGWGTEAHGVGGLWGGVLVGWWVGQGTGAETGKERSVARRWAGDGSQPNTARRGGAGDSAPFHSRPEGPSPTWLSHGLG